MPKKTVKVITPRKVKTKVITPRKIVKVAKPKKVKEKVYEEKKKVSTNGKRRRDSSKKKFDQLKSK